MTETCYMDQMFVVVYWYDRDVLHGSNVCCSLLV